MENIRRKEELKLKEEKEAAEILRKQMKVIAIFQGGYVLVITLNDLGVSMLCDVLNHIYQSSPGLRNLQNVLSCTQK